MKKVVLFGTMPKATNGVFSGPQRVAYNLFNSIKDTPDYDIVFLAMASSKITNKAKNKSKEKIIHSSFLGCIQYILKNRPSIVHIVQYTGRSILFLLWLKKILHFKLIYTCHGVVKYEIEKSENLKNRDLFIEGKIFERADLIIAVSQDLQNMIKRLYPKIDKEKLDVISNGIEENRTYKKVEVRKKYNIPKEKKILLSVGVRKIKNTKKIVENYLKLKDANFVLVVCGDKSNKYAQEIMGCYKKEIKDGKIIFTGFIGQDELYSFYEESHIYIQLSEIETFGLSVVEAMAFQTPVIISQGVGMNYLINKDKDKIMIHTSYEEFEKAIGFIQNNRAEIIRNNEQILKKLNWKTIGEIYTRKYLID